MTAALVESGQAMSPELNDLIQANLSLAQSIAAQIWRQAPQAMELSELTSLAYMGLVTAASRWYAYCEKNGYDPDRIEYFQPFAARRMKGTIYDHLRRFDFATRSQRTKAKALQAAGQDLGLSTDELAERTGMTTADIRATISSMGRRPVSLDTDDYYDLGDSTDVEGAVAEASMLSDVAQAVQSLPPAQQAVLALHYFGHYELQEVARLMGITESRASHLHTDGVLQVWGELRRAFAHLETG